MRNLRPILLSVFTLLLPTVSATAQGVTFRGGERMVTIAWQPVRDSMATYHVFRAADSTSAGTDISGALMKTSSFVDKTLTPGALYFYSVEIKTPTAGPKPIRTPPQRFTLMKAPVALPRKP